MTNLVRFNPYIIEHLVVNEQTENKMSDYSKLSDADFERILGELMDNAPASALLAVPGVYEAVSEHFNNDVLNAWEAEQEDDEPDFDYCLETFVEGCNKLANANLEESYPFVVKIVPKSGKRYVKLVRSEVVRETGAEQGGSVHCFVDTRNGDVLKAASWKAPAKGARGNIFDENNGLGRMGPYGAGYNR